MAATETIEELGAIEAEPLSYKNVVVLRVSIHCQGCRRKVEKILKAVHGVHTIDIDLRQHKVVVTGNVNSDTLIHKLTKAGKHAELWPQLKAPDSKKKKQPKPDKPESSEGTNENDDEEEAVADKEGTNAVRNSEGCAGANANKPNEGCATGKAGVQIQEPPKQEVRQTVVLPPVGPVTQKKVSIAVQVPNDNEAATGSEINKTGGSGAKKKKKKVTEKGTTNYNANNEDHASASDAKANDGSGNKSHGQTQTQGLHGPVLPGSVPFSSPANESPPRHHHIYRQYPPHYYAPPPPVVHHTVMSYHTAHPSSSYGAAYYAPPQPYSYTHTHVVRPGNEMEPPPLPQPYTYERESYTPSQPSDSFELFSDENPNACSVM